ncbi:MAG: hypothetical protein EP330_25315 [Deltaproteobacteria bacterium]|nr:MAG: hypothetical protein EP330_25315 [Deltaproteobacteria bacterium]
MALRRLLRRLITGREQGLRRRLLRRLFRGLSTPTPPPAAEEPAKAPANGTRLASLDELGEGEVLEVMLDGEPVALCRTPDGVFAVDGTCPHAGGPLGDGDLDGTTLTCPYHGWAFDVRTGECLMDDALTVPRIPVEVVDGDVVALDRES